MGTGAKRQGQHKQYTSQTRPQWWPTYLLYIQVSVHWSSTYSLSANLCHCALSVSHYLKHTTLHYTTLTPPLSASQSKRPDVPAYQKPNLSRTVRQSDSRLVRQHISSAQYQPADRCCSGLMERMMPGRCLRFADDTCWRDSPNQITIITIITITSLDRTVSCAHYPIHIHIHRAKAILDVPVLTQLGLLFLR